jgi:hypothetical protein
MDTKRENLYQKIKPECLSIRALIFQITYYNLLLQLSRHAQCSMGYSQ